MPVRLHSLVEIYIQEEQGKGFVSDVNQEVATLLSLLTKVGPIDVYALDIGANSGAWTTALKSRNPAAKVDLFEPNPFHWETLEKLARNMSEVNLFRFGLADFEGEANFYADSEGSTMASLQQRELEHVNLNFQNIGKVQIKTLDSLYPLGLNRPNVIKIDVEGYEYKVLLGGTELLRNVDLLQFEFGGTALDTRIFFKDFWRFLHDEFIIYRQTPRGLIEISQYSEQDEVFRYSNYFALRRHRI